jgi:hypothetical protein
MLIFKLKTEVCFIARNSEGNNYWRELDVDGSVELIDKELFKGL